MSDRLPCRVCYRRTALTARGNVRWHAARDAAGRTLLAAFGGVYTAPCPGVALPPLGVPIAGPEPELRPEQVRDLSTITGEGGLSGTVYLLHLHKPFVHARHYLGWASPGHLGYRLGHHAAGSGANLLRHVAAAGIGWDLARTWDGDRYLERRLKNRGGAARLCPSCRPELLPRLLLSGGHR